jgi:hypothetical protein
VWCACSHMCVCAHCIYVYCVRSLCAQSAHWCRKARAPLCCCRSCAISRTPRTTWKVTSRVTWRHVLPLPPRALMTSHLLLLTHPQHPRPLSLRHRLSAQRRLRLLLHLLLTRPQSRATRHRPHLHLRQPRQQCHRLHPHPQTPQLSTCHTRRRAGTTAACRARRLVCRGRRAGVCMHHQTLCTCVRAVLTAPTRTESALSRRPLNSFVVRPSSQVRARVCVCAVTVRSLCVCTVCRCHTGRLSFALTRAPRWHCGPRYVPPPLVFSNVLTMEPRIAGIVHAWHGTEPDGNGRRGYSIEQAPGVCVCVCMCVLCACMSAPLPTETFDSIEALLQSLQLRFDEPATAPAPTPTAGVCVCSGYITTSRTHTQVLCAHCCQAGWLSHLTMALCTMLIRCVRRAGVCDVRPHIPPPPPPPPH